ncbi:hypothetical protein KQI84_08430 [bacterium]|nr:hypothetical protein [bacterium]
MKTLDWDYFVKPPHDGIHILMSSGVCRVKLDDFQRLEVSGLAWLVAGCEWRYRKSLGPTEVELPKAGSFPSRLVWFTGFPSLWQRAGGELIYWESEENAKFTQLGDFWKTSDLRPDQAQNLDSRNSLIRLTRVVEREPAGFFELMTGLSTTVGDIMNSATEPYRKWVHDYFRLFLEQPESAQTEDLERILAIEDEHRLFADSCVELISNSIKYARTAYPVVEHQPAFSNPARVRMICCDPGDGVHDNLVEVMKRELGHTSGNLLNALSISPTNSRATLEAACALRLLHIERKKHGLISILKYLSSLDADSAFDQACFTMISNEGCLTFEFREAKDLDYFREHRELIQREVEASPGMLQEEGHACFLNLWKRALEFVRRSSKFTTLPASFGCQIMIEFRLRKRVQ